MRSFLPLGGLLAASALALSAIILFAPPPAASKSGGANPGFAGHTLRSDGSPQTCTVCHSSYELNAGTGSLTLDVAETAEGGATVPLTITLDNQTPEASEGSRRQGFEVTVRDPETGEVWGDLVLSDPAHTAYAGDGASRDSAFVTHTIGGTAQSTWTLDWKPGTERTGVARVYVAANAANGNGSTSGDYIYFATADVALDGVATPQAPTGFAVGEIRPNPVRGRGRARVPLRSDRAAEVTVTLVDGLGRSVRPTTRRAVAAGGSSVEVATDGLATGLYFVVVEGPGGRQTQPLAVVR